MSNTTTKKTFISHTTIDKQHELKGEIKEFIKNPDIRVDKISTSVEYLGNDKVKIKYVVTYHEKINVSNDGADRLLNALLGESEDAEPSDNAVNPELCDDVVKI